MRILHWAAIIFAGFAPAAFAQIGNIPGTGYTGAPYSAVETQVYQGNMMTILIARDIEGRTRQEYISHDKDGVEVHSIRVFDPTIGGTLMWRVGGSDATHTVSVFPLAPKQRGTAPVPHYSEAVPGKKPCGAGCNVEFLPTQPINGYVCQGFRVKRMVRDPSTKSLSIQTTENWTYPELGIILRHIEIDELGGRIQSEINNIVRGEPDPALFRAPEGYALVPDYSAGQGGR